MNKSLPILDPRIPSWSSSTLVKRSCPTCQGTKVGQSWIRPDKLNVLECDTCKTLYVSPAPDESSLERFYEQYHQAYFAPFLAEPATQQTAPKTRLFPPKRQHASDLRVARISRYLDLNGKRTLDVGCGRGRLMGLMLSMGSQVFGVDPDQAAVDYARASGLTSVWQGGIDSVDPSLVFDLITISDVIEHPLDPQRLLSECFNRLKPGGLIMIWTPNADHARKDSERVMFRIHLEHMQYFCESSLKTLCHRTHLKVLHTEKHGHPYLGTIQQLTGKRRYCEPLFQRLRAGINLAAIRWPRVFENSYLRNVRGTYSLLAILQR